jgi:Protoglobin
MKPAAERDKTGSDRLDQLTSSIDLAELLQVLGIDERTRDYGRQLAGILEQHGDDLFSEFYQRISKISFAYKFGIGQVETLKQRQLKHWINLFTCRLDVNYMRNAALVGDVHRQRGIEPLLYIAGYSIVKSVLMGIIARKDIVPAVKGGLVIALEKYISLDMGLAMVGYSGHRVYAQMFAPGLSH